MKSCLKRIETLTLLLAPAILSGCMKLEEMSELDGVSTSSGGFLNNLASNAANAIVPFYESLRVYAVPAAIISFIVGILLLVFFGTSRTMTKYAIFSLMIFIPLLLILLQLGLGAWLSNSGYGTELESIKGKADYELLTSVVGITVYSHMISSLNPIQYLAMGFVLYCEQFSILLALSSIAVGVILKITVKTSQTINKVAVKVMIIGIPLFEIGLNIAARMVVATTGIAI